MTVLTCSSLSLSFGHLDILRDVTFGVEESARVGVIGVNGAGKTSLFRLITGEYTPDSGSVYIARGKTVGMLAQNTDLSAYGEMSLLSYMYGAFPELIKAEENLLTLEHDLAVASREGDEEKIRQLTEELTEANIAFADAGGLEFRSRCRSMLLRLGFGEERLDQSVSSLSGGQHTRLSLARLLAREPDLLLLDEPTNHLDIDALQWLEDFLSSYKKTILVISHDRYFLDRVTTMTLQIEHTRARMYHGNYTQTKEQQAADAASLAHRYKEQQKEIARIRANIEFQRRCGQAHNFVTIRAKEKQLARMDRVELAPPPPRGIRMRFSVEEESAGHVLEVRHLAFSYDAAPLLTDLSFLIQKGERVLFLGANGCGKSTLMKLINGMLTPKSGALELGYNIKIGYYDQENRGLTETNTVLEELHSTYPDRTNTEIRSNLALFLFDADDVEKQVRSLSGGERARLTLAKLIMKKVNLLVMDEPTNHLDIGSREALETALEAFEGTVIAVSHDRYFIDRIATRIIELDRAAEGGCIDYPIWEGEQPYETYRRLRETHRAQTQTASPTPASEGKLRYEAKKKEDADARRLLRAKEKAKTRAEELERELTVLEEELFGPAASDYVRAAEIDARKTEIEEELLTLYEQIM